MSRLPLLRVLLTTHLRFAAIALGVLLLGTFAVLAVVQVTEPLAIDRSFWHYTATQSTRWLAFLCGVDAVGTYLRPHLAHGRTRGDFLRSLAPYLVGLAVSLGLATTLGYLVERGVYAVGRWPQAIAYRASFGEADNYLGIFGAYSLALLLFATAGALLAAAFRRTVVLGLALVPFGVLMIVPSEFLVGRNGVPRLTEVLADLHYPQNLGVALSPAVLVVAGLVMWLIMRRMPLRQRVA